MTNAITAADAGSTVSSGNQGGQSIITGSPTIGSVAVSVAAPVGALAIQILGTFVATMQVEGSADGGSTYVAIDALIEGINTIVQQVTKNAVLLINATGFTNIRVRATAWTSGSAIISFFGVPSTDLHHVSIVAGGGGGGGGNVNVTNLPTTVDVNSGNATANTQRIAVDGTAASGVSEPTGGVGAIGWLSGIFNKLNTFITVRMGTGTYTSAGGTATTSASTGLAASTATQVIWLQNLSSNILGYTLDGSTPVIGNSNTLTLGPIGTNNGQGVKITPVPTAALNVIGSASGTVYGLLYI